MRGVLHDYNRFMEEGEDEQDGARRWWNFVKGSLESLEATNSELLLVSKITYGR